MNSELLNKVDNSIDAIIWLNGDDFNSSTRYFQEFNYLTSGILEKKESNLVGLYQTQNFNLSMNIALVNKSKDQTSLIASEPVMSVLRSNSPKKILIVHENIEDKLVEKFTKKYKGQEFLEFSTKKETENE